MSMEQMDARLAAIESRLTGIDRKLDQLGTAPGESKPAPWWEPVGPPMTPEESKVFDEVLAYGRYFRRTGRDAPPDWRPGDPIPEVEFDE